MGFRMALLRFAAPSLIYSHCVYLRLFVCMQGPGNGPRMQRCQGWLITDNAGKVRPQILRAP